MSSSHEAVNRYRRSPARPHSTYSIGIDDGVTTMFAGAATFLEEVDDADQVFGF
jgi:hypothetical protein